MTGDASSRVGILHVKGYNITIEAWQCNHPGFTTTSAIQTSNDLELRSDYTLKIK